MTIHIDDKLHQAVSIAARVMGVSIKDFISDALADKLEKEKPHVLSAIEGKMTVPDNGAAVEAK